MKNLVSKYMAACLVALCGYSSSNASPTFHPVCFETEAKAIAHQSQYKYREVDNSATSQMDDRAREFTFQNDVLLSDLKSILGESVMKLDEDTKLVTHEWALIYTWSSSADEVRYDISNGYCVSTRGPSYGMITYIFKAEVFDETRGSLTRHEFYM